MSTVQLMRVELLHVPDCPNVSSTMSRLEEALRRAGVTAQIELVAIASTADARLRGMRGSPTILVDGRDAFDSSRTEGALACRLFQTPSGLAGTPTTEQLIEVLST